MSVPGWTIDTLRDSLVDSIAAERRVLEQRLEGMDKAQSLLAIELARRLEVLNHAHERAVEVQHTYLPRELFDKSIEELAAWRSAVDKSLAQSAERKAVIAALLVAALSLVGVVINTVLRITG